MEGEYTGEHARVYHQRFKDSNREDVPYYRDLATAVEGPTLEIACGTGRVYLELLEAGVDVDGFDISAGALSVLREFAERRGLDPSVWQASMTELAVEREYTLALCPFNTLQHLRSIEDQLAALGAIHDSLAPGGRFVFDVFVPNFELICETYGEWQTETVDVDGRRYELQTRSTLVDEVRQVFLVEETATGPDGQEAFSIEHELKMLPPREVEFLVERSPFDGWTVTGDFTDEPLTDGHSVQVWELMT